MSVNVLTPDEVAREMRIGNKSVYRDLKAGVCPGWLEGRNWKIHRDDLAIYRDNLIEMTRVRLQKEADAKATEGGITPDASFRLFFPETVKLKKGKRHGIKAS